MSIQVKHIYTYIPVSKMSSNKYFSDYNNSRTSSNGSNSPNGSNNKYFPNSDYAQRSSTQSKISQFHTDVDDDIRRRRTHNSTQQSMCLPQPPIQHHIVIVQSQPQSQTQTQTQTQTQPQTQTTFVLPPQYFLNPNPFVRFP